eukprot:CAMPEP_0173186836 /NCGR_PEP_ID=MMETSP1141-20130122/10360_1 /TAXON_ID=483371 /ORGANISM="non described non described, Strain CCMP2298" /LENGTH=127 /DNA_ID=CAMNT_0014110577 /DNA_START=213 /DNA_END=596 /DNA_ORIENTATION=+
MTLYSPLAGQAGVCAQHQTFDQIFDDKDDDNEYDDDQAAMMPYTFLRCSQYHSSTSHSPCWSGLVGLNLSVLRLFSSSHNSFARSKSPSSLANRIIRAIIGFRDCKSYISEAAWKLPRVSASLLSTS